MNPMITAYGALALAVTLEVVATSLLPKTAQFTRLWPTLAMLMCYMAAFYLLTFTVKLVPVGIAYALWSGIGVVLISAVGYFWLRQTLDDAALIGIGFIITGVVVINLFSQSIVH